MPKYEVTAPNGKMLEIEGDHVPTEAQLQDIFNAAGVASEPTQAERLAQLKNANETPLAEPTTYAGGVVKSLAETASGVGRGVKKGLASLVSPSTYVEAAKAAADVPLMVADPTGPAAERMKARAAGVIEQAKRVASGDPEAGGEALAQIAMTVATPSVVGAARAIPPGVQRALTLVKSNAPQAARIARIAATDPDAIGMFSPRAAHAMRMAEKARNVVGKAREVAAARDANLPAEFMAVGEETPAATSAAPTASDARHAELVNKFADEPKLQDTRYTQAVESARAPRSINDAMKEAIAQHEAARKASAAPPAVKRAQAVQAVQQAAGKVKLTGDEVKAISQMIDAGQDADTAFQTVIALRESSLGRITPTAVRNAVKARNASGRWAAGQ